MTTVVTTLSLDTTNTIPSVEPPPSKWRIWTTIDNLVLQYQQQQENSDDEQSTPKNNEERSQKQSSTTTIRKTTTTSTNNDTWNDRPIIINTNEYSTGNTVNNNSNKYDRSYLNITNNIVQILQLWGNTYCMEQPIEWAHIFNKSSFQHEIEESMVAIYYLNEWRENTTTTITNSTTVSSASSFIAIDVCGGKGIFSMLLQYYAILFWNQGIDNQKVLVLDHIILIERRTKDVINWNHLNNLLALPKDVLVKNDRRIPMIQIWDDCNLYDYDILYDRLLIQRQQNTNNNNQDPTNPIQEQQQQQSSLLPYAMTGIHLCKLLSPAFISLVNLLGPTVCPYTCLVPCCLPRIVRSKKNNNYTPNIITKTNNNKKLKANKKKTTGADTGAQANDNTSILQVYQYETSIERIQRLERKQLRQQAKNRSRICSICKLPDHVLYKCPVYKELSYNEQQKYIIEDLAATPCWICGRLGHYKTSCPDNNTRKKQDTEQDNQTDSQSNKQSSSSVVSLSSSFEPPIKVLDVSKILQQSNPMLSYCHLLSTGIDWWGTSASTTGSQDQQQRSNNNIRIIQTGLVPPSTNNNNNSSNNDTKITKQKDIIHTNNWNGHRKSIYIVASS